MLACIHGLCITGLSHDSVENMEKEEKNKSIQVLTYVPELTGKSFKEKLGKLTCIYFSVGRLTI